MSSTSAAALTERGTGRRRSRPVPHLVTTVQELRDAVSTIMRDTHFVIDVETTRDNPHTNEILWVGLGCTGSVYLIPINHPLGYITVPEHEERRLPPDEERKVLSSGKLSSAKRLYKVPASYTQRIQQLDPITVFDALEPLLFGSMHKIGQNLKFDLLSLSKYYGGRIPSGPYHDTIILTHLLDENRMTYGLKDLICDWLDIPQKNRKTFYPNLGRSGIEVEPADAVARYLAKDIRYTWLYWKSQYPRIARQGLQEAYDVEMSLYGVLMHMEQTGFPIDHTRLAEVGKEMDKEIASIENDIWKIAGFQFEMTNLNTKRDLLFKPKKEGGQGLKPLNKTVKTGAAQLNKATLEHYQDNPLAKLMLDWSKMEKLRGTFVKGLSGHLIDGRVHTSFKHHGTVTGRLSATEPNLQQIPARGEGAFIRDMFVAEEDHLLVVADYDQIELRCAAYLSGDKEMCKVFIEEQDIHKAAAAAMYGISIADVTKEQRQNGKGQNFLTLYGGGAKKLANTSGVDIETAELFIKRYYRQFPELHAWKDRIVSDAKERGKQEDPFRFPPYALIPPFGRKRRLPDLYSPMEYDRYRGERQAVNAVVQGFASYVMKIALIDLHTALKPYGAKMLATVHDEIVVSCPLSSVEAVKELIVNTMCGVTVNGQPVLGDVPLVASAGVGKSWNEAKD